MQPFKMFQTNNMAAVKLHAAIQEVVAPDIAKTALDEALS